LASEGAAIQPIYKGPALLKFGRIEERSRDFCASAAETIMVSTAAIEFASPIFEARLIGLAAKEVEILLPDEVLVCIDRVARRFSIRYCREYGICFVPSERERAVGRAEPIICECRRDTVEVVGVHVIKAIVAVVV